MPQYHYRLANGDDLLVRFTTVRRKKRSAVFDEFCLSYRIEVGGEWREVTRVDNAHGSDPHQHIFTRDRTERRKVLGERKESAAVFEQMRKELLSQYLAYRERFLAQ